MTSLSTAEALDLENPSQPLWIFGYGSLVWRPAFEYVQLKYGYIKGYKRRFWQGSTDHRGVVGAPGRVVTLVHHTEVDYSSPIDKELCASAESEVKGVWGVAYQVAADKVKETLEYLDVREQGGYTRSFIEVYEKPEDDTPMLREVLLYTATTQNRNYIGPAPISTIAGVIAKSVGPSGPNIEYLYRLHQKLVEQGIEDSHVNTLYETVVEIVAKNGTLVSDPLVQ